MHLDNFDIDAFLRDHWQKKPLLIRNALPGWANPLEPDELAGLACEDEVESRLVVAEPGGLKLHHGPFAEDRFAALGARPWTLLVQAVDHYVPDVAALLAPFRFVPGWRIDDVMVSYASDGGGVGAHFDRYDVFLVQGLGQRRWRIGAACDDTTPLRPDTDLCLLADFEPVAEWVLNPGDILYLPPGVAHDGVAVGDDCMTYSVGFRAPSRSELLGGFVEHLLADLAEDDRYADPDLVRQDNPGEITAQAVAGLHGLVTQAASDAAAFARWFGEYSTRPKNPEIDWRPEHAPEAGDVQAHIAAGTALCRNPASRFAFVREQGGSLVLFVDGVASECDGAAATFAERVCAEDRLLLAPDDVAAGPVLALLLDLLAQGSVAFDEDD
jgi:50S ribosomal protein L16 3-hydroxylase